MCKEDVNVMPIWIQLTLDFKYWGMSCLEKIIQPLGKLIKVHHSTSKRDKLQYATIMVQVNTGQQLPEELKFINERNIITGVPIHYEWKPIVCNTCKSMGHDTAKCTKTVVRQEWRMRKPPVQTEGRKQNDIPEVQMNKIFPLVRNPARRSLACFIATPTL